MGVASLGVCDFGDGRVEDQARGRSSQAPRAHQRGGGRAHLADGQLRIFSPAVRCCTSDRNRWLTAVIA